MNSFEYSIGHFNNRNFNMFQPDFIPETDFENLLSTIRCETTDPIEKFCPDYNCHHFTNACTGMQLLPQLYGQNENQEDVKVSGDDDSYETVTTDNPDTQRRSGGGVKGDRTRTLISERKRRSGMKEKLYALRALVPYITKMDKASIVGDAARYIQDLQTQARNLRSEIAKLKHQKTNKCRGVAVALHKALESITSFQVQSSNLATVGDEFVLIFTLNDLEKILCDSPWNVMGFYLSMAPWDPNKSFAEIDFSQGSFWVQAHNLPLGKLTKSFATDLAKRIGILLDIDCESYQKDLNFDQQADGQSIQGKQTPSSLIRLPTMPENSTPTTHSNNPKTIVSTTTQTIPTQPQIIITNLVKTHIPTNLFEPRSLNRKPNTEQPVYFITSPTESPVWWLRKISHKTNVNMLSWNCQGVGRPLTVSHLRELCQTHRAEVVFLMETKNKERRMESIRRSLHFSGYYYIHPAGLSGIYLIGDLSDKQGSSTNISHQIEEFQDFISASMLFDIPFKGLSNMWDNNRKDGASIRERIDCALANDDLVEAFPHHMLTHHPLIAEIKSIQSLPPTSENCARQNFLKLKLEEIWLKEEMFWHRRSRNEWIDDPKALNQLILNHFKAVYSSSRARDFSDVLKPIDVVVYESMNLSLEAPVSDSEIHKAVMQLGALKAPRKDGFPGLFFQRYWHIVSNSVIKVVRQVFENGVMPSSLNKTVIVLVPKVPSPEKVGFKPFIHKIISPQQSTFIPSRLIQDSKVKASISQSQLPISLQIPQKQIMNPKARYLCMPSIHGRNKSELFSFILERVLNKMQGFLNKLLSYVKRFFWGGYAHGSHIHWVSRDHISKPKDEGGLGFRDLKAFNLALLAKQGYSMVHLFHNSQLLILWFFIAPLKKVHVHLFHNSQLLILWFFIAPLKKVHLNCDGAFKLNQGVVGIATRNCEGSLLLCLGERWHASSVIATEVITLRSECSLAMMKRWHNVIIESDSQLAISLASSESDPPWSLDAIVGDIKD
ncbi:Myc-type, basic helix-loop-helix (bHLH) domain-containing protein [Artemisia annua]|uniref:Myc-type, basic helix-loop-helix (BHLH) domain-containing protein n=1 Tax=Artemisia annua TaxID=35608 RepID=A0A2U1PJ07_ARTAN|nr:Myc-type, basic helix-loop-helix (bHLH) domain-containing protein [Artemisia annua]